MIKIIPAILVDNPADLKDRIQRIEELVERVQIDIIDGEFADNKTILPESVGDIDTDLLFDYHLMVKEPINWIEKSIRGYADRIIGQIEMMNSQNEFVSEIVTKGYKAGLALDLKTGLDKLDIHVLEEVDVVLLMSVPAGFGGQDFQPMVLEKIAQLSQLRSEQDLDFNICDDGGISLENIDDIHYLGVDEVSIGSALYSGDIATNLEKFQKAAHNVKLIQ